jgi:hypothetical protein
MKAILERAARTGNAQMRVQSLSPTGGRTGWSGPTGNGNGPRCGSKTDSSTAPASVDTEAREKWFYQAIGASPAMFRRDPQAGSLYGLGHRDATGAYLDGGRAYKLTVPLPVPGKLFWSVTVYDAHTRSQIQTGQAKAVISSLFDFPDTAGDDSVDLFFGPTAPAGHQDQWIQTNPGAGWFVYFRIYGPEQAAFDKTWKPGDFEPQA